MGWSAEHRQADEVKAEKRAVAEWEAVESDRRWRATLYAGIPAALIPEGLAPAAAMIAAAHANRPRRTSVLEDSLSRSGTTFHPIRHDADEE